MAGLADLQVSNGDLGVDRGLAARLGAISGVRSVRPLLIRRVLLPGLDGRSAVLLGVDLASEPPQAMADALGVTITEAAALAFLQAMLRRQGPVLVGGALGRELPKEGEVFSVLAGGKTRRVTRVGTIEARGESDGNDSGRASGAATALGGTCC